MSKSPEKQTTDRVALYAELFVTDPKKAAEKLRKALSRYSDHDKRVLSGSLAGEGRTPYEKYGSISFSSFLSSIISRVEGAKNKHLIAAVLLEKDEKGQNFMQHIVQESLAIYAYEAGLEQQARLPKSIAKTQRVRFADEPIAPSQIPLREGYDAWKSTINNSLSLNITTVAEVATNYLGEDQLKSIFFEQDMVRILVDIDPRALMKTFESLQRKGAMNIDNLNDFAFVATRLVAVGCNHCLCSFLERAASFIPTKDEKGAGNQKMSSATARKLLGQMVFSSEERRPENLRTKDQPIFKDVVELAAADRNFAAHANAFMKKIKTAFSIEMKEVPPSSTRPNYKLQMQLDPRAAPTIFLQ